MAEVLSLVVHILQVAALLSPFPPLLPDTTTTASSSRQVVGTGRGRSSHVMTVLPTSSCSPQYKGSQCTGLGMGSLDGAYHSLPIWQKKTHLQMYLADYELDWYF